MSTAAGPRLLPFPLHRYGQPLTGSRSKGRPQLQCACKCQSAASSCFDLFLPSLPSTVAGDGPFRAGRLKHPVRPAPHHFARYTRTRGSAKGGGGRAPAGGAWNGCVGALSQQQPRAASGCRASLSNAPRFGTRPGATLSKARFSSQASFVSSAVTLCCPLLTPIVGRRLSIASTAPCRCPLRSYLEGRGVSKHGVNPGGSCWIDSFGIRGRWRSRIGSPTGCPSTRPSASAWVCLHIAAELEPWLIRYAKEVQTSSHILIGTKMDCFPQLTRSLWNWHWRHTGTIL